MTKAVRAEKIPEQSIIRKKLEQIDYFDSYKVYVQSTDTIDTVLTEIFSVPSWVTCLLTLRDQFAKWLQLKIVNETENVIASYYRIGTRAVLFTVLDRNEKEIVMGENDKHLYFRTSVFLEEAAEQRIIYLSTLVRYHNRLGRIYFSIVRPFHQVIVKSILKRYAIRQLKTV